MFHIFLALRCLQSCHNPLLSPAVCLSCVLGVENEGDDPLDWLRSSIPGEPGTDYPIMAATQVSVHILLFISFEFLVFRTVASLAMDWCLGATTQTQPQTASSTASACRTRSARTPSTQSTSSAPTAPSSTSSCSTATGGQCLLSKFNCLTLTCLRFNVDCEASEGLYGGAEGAFGTAGGSGGGEDAGSCPAASPGSPDECAGAVSTCWSPGQRDTDCPGNGLCCVSIRAKGYVEELIPYPLTVLTKH